MSSSKNRPVKELSGSCLYVGGQESNTPPPHTVQYMCIKFTYSHKEWGMGGDIYQRERERGTSSQSLVEHTNMNAPVCKL
jgi:hypothetical protein